MHSVPYVGEAAQKAKGEIISSNNMHRRYEDSNCGRIHRGHNAPGTIIQMLGGCGPGKYTVAKSLIPSRK